jgi:holo-[acyl-carrier protein] synthase
MPRPERIARRAANAPVAAGRAAAGPVAAGPVAASRTAAGALGPAAGGTDPPDCPGPRVLIGTDIVTVDRLARLFADQPAVADRIFTARELSYCEGRRRRAEHLAARFAAKEAVLKALGTGLGTGMRWTDVEVVNRLGGRPEVRLYGQVAAVARRRRMRHIDVSLSHVAGLALASAALVCQDRCRDLPAAEPAAGPEDPKWTE